jgi:hypothetical protein
MAPWDVIRQVGSISELLILLEHLILTPVVVGFVLHID